MSSLPFYIGTRTNKTTSEGIYLAHLDSGTGEIKDVKLAAKAMNPSFVALSPDGSRLYAATSDFEISAFARGNDGMLTLLNTTNSGGGLCHVAVDLAGKAIFGANYGAGTAVAYKLKEDGSLGEQTSLHKFSGTGPNAKRQDKSHAHSTFVSPDNRFVYICDLGCDKIWIFKLDPETGALAAADPASGESPAGGGPRHLVFWGDKVYVNNELTNSVSVYIRDAATGAMEHLQTAATLEQDEPNEEITTSAIKMHPSGRWLYVSNRGAETIAVFSVAEEGWVTLIQEAPAGVVCPRDFELDPAGTWLLAAGQKDHQIASHGIDPATGMLTASGYRYSIDEPVCIVFPQDG